MAVSQYLEHLGIQIASGLVINTSHINKFGFNDTVGTDWEPIQIGSAPIVYPTTAAVVTVVSTSGQDNTTGIGARTVEIQGLDSEYNEQVENITLTGTSPVATLKTFIRIFRIKVLTAGSSGKPQGNLTSSISGNTQVILDNEYDNQSLHAAYTIPARHDGYLVRMQATSTKDNKAAMVAMTAREFGANTVWQIKQLTEMYRNSVVVDFPVPLRFTEKTDLEMRGKNLNNGNVSIGGTFDLILVRK